MHGAHLHGTNGHRQNLYQEMLATITDAPCVNTFQRCLSCLITWLLNLLPIYLCQCVLPAYWLPACPSPENLCVLQSVAPGANRKIEIASFQQARRLMDPRGHRSFQGAGALTQAARLGKSLLSCEAESVFLNKRRTEPTAKLDRNIQRPRNM